VFTYDDIPPTGPLTVTLRLPRRPKAVHLEPGHRAMPFRYADGKAEVTVPTLAIHAVLVVTGGGEGIDHG
jgi:hypothetical protein